MQHHSSSSILETISSINRDTNISHNMMAYRLGLLMEKHSSHIQPTVSLDTNEREHLLKEARTIFSLSNTTQNIEDYRQSLKDKYYKEYLQKFEINQPISDASALNNSIRVDNLIADKKKVFLHQIIEREQRQLPKDTEPKIQSENHASTPAEGEAINKSIIGSILNTLVNMGQDTDNQGRIYDGIAYQLQLWMKEGIQLLNVNRKNGSPYNAFTAVKQDTQAQFQILQNNLSQEESQRIINFDRVHNTQQSHIHPTIDPDDNAELGD
ncbi:hypothetical protein H6G76_25820 [Nostoc sp. FACHB-152]|uniref:hypothetical protein n=1 Tax=Nostoc sp. FACHB-152 TaxID=2692837 RepID=UPI001686A48F|nr:hypothetical protein [Nostoc sp. FACHB-152]MBD2450509.1 hypothetical protein [Nostoc sp. FACHB-152]